MQEPHETRNYAASIIDVLRYCSTGSIANLLSSLGEKDVLIEQRNRLIEQQRSLINRLETRTGKLTTLYKFEQEHRLGFESKVIHLTRQAEEYKATLEDLKDALTLRSTNLTQQERINHLEDENKDLQLRIDQCQLTIKDFKNQVCHGEKQTSGLRDERAYLETQNLGLRDELVAKDMHHRYANEEIVSYYRSKLGPYEHAIEILHALSQQDGEELSVAAYFAQALKLKGLQLHTVDIDEHRAGLLFEHVRHGQHMYSAFQPPTFERGFRCKGHQPTLPAVPVLSFTPPNTLGSIPAAPAPGTQQPTSTPDESSSGGQTGQFGASNDESGGPPPPFPIEIWSNRRDYHNMDSPFAVDINGSYLDEKAAKSADRKIEKWEKKQEKGSGGNANSEDPADSSDCNVQQHGGTQIDGNPGKQQTGATMFTMPFPNATSQNQPAQQQPSSFASYQHSDPMDTTPSDEPTFSFLPQPSTGANHLNQNQSAFGQPAQQTAQPSTFGQPLQYGFSTSGQPGQQQPQQPPNPFANPFNPLPTPLAASKPSRAPTQTTSSFGMPLPQQNPPGTTTTWSLNYRVSPVDEDVFMS